MAFYKTRPKICYNCSNLSIVINQRFPSQQTKVANIEDIICYFASSFLWL